MCGITRWLDRAINFIAYTYRLGDMVIFAYEATLLLRATVCSCTARVDFPFFTHNNKRCVALPKYHSSVCKMCHIS